MVAYSVATRIVGEDGLSEVFRKVGQAAKSAWHPVTMFNQAVGEPNTTALGKLGAKVDGVAGKFRAGLGSISAWLPALGAIGSALTLGGLVEMTRHAAEGYEGLTLASKKLGVAGKDLAVWRYGAKLAGVENEQLEKGLVKLNKTMYDAATGKNKDVAGLFRAMKIPLRDAKGEVKGVGNSLEDIAEAFKNTENPAMRDAAAMALFGRAGADLLPFLMKGRAGIAELRTEMKKYSGLTDENREGLEHLALSYKQLDKAGSGLSSKLSAVFAPKLALVVDATTGWIVANRDLIAQSLDRKLTRVGEAIEFVGKIAKEIGQLPFVRALTEGADASTALDIGLGLLGSTMMGPLAAGIGAVATAIVRMNLALYANPWVLAVAAAAFAAYELHRHWDDIPTWWAETMDKIHAASEHGFAAEVWETYKQGMLVLPRAVNVMVKDLTGIDLFAIGRAWVAGLINGIKSLLPDFKSLTAGLTAWAVKIDGAIAPPSTITLPRPAGSPQTAQSAAGDVAAAYRRAADQSTETPAPPRDPYDRFRTSGFDPLALAVNAAPAPAASPPPPVRNEISITINKAGPAATVETESKGGGNASVNVGYSMQDNT